jgi:hypothetical protein
MVRSRLLFLDQFDDKQNDMHGLRVPLHTFCSNCAECASFFVEQKKIKREKER